MKILLGIVHNNEQERLDYLLNELPKLQNPDFYFQIIDYGIQVEKSITLVSTLKKTFSVLDYTIRWLSTQSKVFLKSLRGKYELRLVSCWEGKQVERNYEKSISSVMLLVGNTLV